MKSMHGLFLMLGAMLWYLIAAVLVVLLAAWLLDKETELGSGQMIDPDDTNNSDGPETDEALEGDGDDGK